MRDKRFRKRIFLARSERKSRIRRRKKRWLNNVNKDKEKQEKRTGGDRVETGMNGNSFWVKPGATRGCRAKDVVDDDDDDDDI